MPSKLSSAEFITKASIIHNGKYDYSAVEYVNNKTKVVIRCPTHGQFTQVPTSHLSGRGCKLCGDSVKNNNKRSSQSIFISKAIEKHGTTYDYSSVVYTKTTEKVTIVCIKHGPFSIVPYAHLAGQGCRICGIERRNSSNTNTTPHFVDIATSVHGRKYNYHRSKYIDIRTKLTITCPTHGDFLQTPSDHLYCLAGCPKCSSNQSNKEQDWLDSLGVKHRQITIMVDGIKYKVDGYDSTTNTVYEFWGDFWHGNPAVYNQQDINVRTGTTFGELYEKTLFKREHLLSSGYNVIDIWECDWNK